LTNGFLKLHKQTMLLLDLLPLRLFKVYLKLLSAASWTGNSTGILGFFETPWSVRDIAHAIHEDHRQLARDIVRLQQTTLPDEHGNPEPLVYYGKFRGAEHLTHYYLPHYILFTDGPQHNDPPE
jgi:hypothetical protein